MPNLTFVVFIALGVVATVFNGMLVGGYTFPRWAYAIPMTFFIWALMWKLRDVAQDRRTKQKHQP